MEEFKEGGRLSPLKVKEFIPEGTLGIGIDENVWIRKSRNDGKTYWSEFLTTSYYTKIRPSFYDLNVGIRFNSTMLSSDDKYDFEITYSYGAEGTDLGGFTVIARDPADAKELLKFQTKDPQKFRDKCIAIRDVDFRMDNWTLSSEFTEIVSKLTFAFERGQLRRNFSETPTDNPPVPEEKEFQVGDLVKVIDDGKNYPASPDWFKEFKFLNEENNSCQNGEEGYIVGSLKYNGKTIYAVKSWIVEQGNIRNEFMIASDGLELVKPAMKEGDFVEIVYPSDIYVGFGTLKEELGFKEPNKKIPRNELIDLKGKIGQIFSKGVDYVNNYVPIYGIKVDNEEYLVQINGIVEITKFQIGDYVSVRNDLQQIMNNYDRQKEFQFENQDFTIDVKNGTEGYIVGIYYEPYYNENRYVVKKLDSNGEILHEFIIAEAGIELVSKALRIGDTVYVKDTTYLFPSAPQLKKSLGFENPNRTTNFQDVTYTTGKVFAVGQSEPYLMPVCGVFVENATEPQQILIEVQGLELVQDKPKNESLSGIKIQLNSPEESRILQEYLYSMDYFWLGSPRGTIMEFDNYPVFMATSDNEDLKAMFTLKKVEFERSTSREVTLESLGIRKTEFICNVDASKINSPSVGSFYAKNKERIEKLNSEFSCKILEALVYLSDYENCGGGIELPAKKVEEVDDLLGEIRNL